MKKQNTTMNKLAPTSKVKVNKTKANTKQRPPKPNPPSAAAKPKKSTTKQNVAICPILGRALYSNPKAAPVELAVVNRGERADDTKPPVFTDPNINVAVNQVLVREDKAPFTLKAAACHTQSTYVKDEAKDKVHRLTWVIPEKIQNSTGGIVKMDRRGQIANIRSATVGFHNVSSSQTIQVRVNTPLGVLDEGNSVSGNLIGTRKPNMVFTLEPGKKRFYNINRFGDKDNLFKPYVGPLKKGDDAWRGLVIADFCAIIPDVNEESGKDNATEQQALSLLNVMAKIRYLTIQDQLADDDTEKFEIRSPQEFYLQNLANVASMFHVDAHLIPSTNLLAMGLPYAIAPRFVQVERVTHNYYKLQWVILKRDSGDGRGGSIVPLTPNTVVPDGTSMALALMHCDAHGQVYGPVAFTSYESTDNRITLLSGGYCYYSDWDDMTHRFVLNNLAYYREFGAWLLTSGGEIFVSSLSGRVQNTPVVEREIAMVVQSTNDPTLYQIGEFKVVPGLQSWVSDLGTILNVVTEIVGFLRIVVALF